MLNKKNLRSLSKEFQKGGTEIEMVRKREFKKKLQKYAARIVSNYGREWEGYVVSNSIAHGKKLLKKFKDNKGIIGTVKILPEIYQDDTILKAGVKSTFL